jgi:hypothetical protein
VSATGGKVTLASVIGEVMQYPNGAANEHREESEVSYPRPELAEARLNGTLYPFQKSAEIESVHPGNAAASDPCLSIAAPRAAR